MPANHSGPGHHARLSDGEHGGDGADQDTCARVFWGMFSMHRL